LATFLKAYSFFHSETFNAAKIKEGLQKQKNYYIQVSKTGESVTSQIIFKIGSRNWCATTQGKEA